jgi:hypothetical protein
MINDKPFRVDFRVEKNANFNTYLVEGHEGEVARGLERFRKIRQRSAAARVCSSQQQQQRGRTPGWEVFPS